MSTTTQNDLNIDIIQDQDPEVAKYLVQELDRQSNKIELIASENFTSRAVMQAQGSWLTNKYAEGLPGKRYYGGCQFVDEVEQMAIDRAKQLFGAEHANVQPHSGASANNAVFLAFLNPGDKIMGMNLSHGGHLTHGSPVNMSGKYFDVTDYGVNQTDELINYDELEATALEVKPKMIIAGASAYPRQIDFERFGQIAKKAGALLLVDMAHIAGLVAAGEHPSPVPHADIVTTTTHKTLRGPRSGLILCKEIHQKAIDKAVFPGTQGGPLMHVIAAKAIALKEAASPEFKQYQQQIRANAKAMAKVFIDRGVRVVSGGTENHIVLVDVRSFKQTGKQAEAALTNVGITVNKNTIPFDPETPFVTSGIRIGTASITTRGFNEEDAAKVASLIVDVLENPEDASVQQRAESVLKEFAVNRPLYPDLVRG